MTNPSCHRTVDVWDALMHGGTVFNEHICLSAINKIRSFLLGFFEFTNLSLKFT
jgi:hypothetical protein